MSLKFLPCVQSSPVKLVHPVHKPLPSSRSRVSGSWQRRNRSRSSPPGCPRRGTDPRLHAAGAGARGKRVFTRSRRRTRGVGLTPAPAPTLVGSLEVGWGGGLGFGDVFPRDKRGRGRHALLQFLIFLGVAGLTLGAPRLLSGRPGRCRITPRPNRDGQECPQMLSCVPAAPADTPGARMRKARGPLVPGAVPHTVGCSPPVCPLAHPRLQVSVLSRQCQMLPEGPERPTPPPHLQLWEPEGAGRALSASRPAASGFPGSCPVSLEGAPAPLTWATGRGFPGSSLLPALPAPPPVELSK